MGRVRWATVRHPPGRSASILRRLSVRRKRASDLSAIGENFGGENLATEGGEDTRDPADKHENESRTIYINLPVDREDLDEDGSLKAIYPRNKVRTARYTPLTFIPKNLWYQFQNVANLYFLLLVVLQAFSIFGATNAGLSAVPLIVIVVITAVKDGIEDYRRTVLDNELNNTPTKMLHHWHNSNVTDERIGIWRRIKKFTSRVIRLVAARRKGVKGDPMDLDRIQTRPSHDIPRISHDLALVDSYAIGNDATIQKSMGNTYESSYVPAQHNYGSVIDRDVAVPGKAVWKRTYWKNVRVGDLVKLKNDDPIPADMVVLSTSEADSACYVETKNLDGETNLKIKHGVRAASRINTTKDCESARFRIESEGPNPNLYSYSAVARWDVRDADTGAIDEKFEAISAETLLLRGSSLRNTSWVIGVVVFTGEDTKIMQNSGASPSKRSRIARELNWTVVSNFLILLLMCIICGVANGIYLRDPSSTFNVFDQGSQAGSAATGGVVTFFTCLILFQNLVPISLYISIEIVKTAQAYFIYSDVDMYHQELDYPCTPKSWNISDDLGQIEYIFSDKTGTLTQNIMEFKKCTINGISYGEAYTEAMIGMAKRENLDTDLITIRERERIAKDKSMMAELMRTHFINPYFTEDEITFVSSDFVRHLNGQNGKEQAAACAEFMTALALCHNVLVERPADRKNYLDYKATSPDEAALVATARDVGFAMPERTQRGLFLESNGERLEYIIMDELEFNSSRKRMSMIFRRPDNSIVLYCKGADSVIYSRLATKQRPGVKEQTAKALDLFANEGLRTLGIAYRELSEEVYQEWQRRHQLAASSVDKREEKIADSCDEIEQELILLGGTAIEDRLQDGVPESIALLGEAGIKLWVLTGDKVETAINIGYSCNLLDNNMSILRLQVPKLDQVDALLDENLKKFGLTGSETELTAARKDHRPPQATNALVIDGDSLKLVLNGDNQITKRKFLLLCKQMKSVLCCRVSPAQKAEVVRMVKDGLDVMTLSIGDGANDVAMIQQADVGVGIAGVEGRQAVMSSDYAIGQFRFLTKLLLVHGRWSYRRLAEMIPCFFNKNIVWTFTLFWYQIFDQYDGQYNFDYTYILLYNLAFTSLPIIFMGAFDQDVSARVSMKVPQLYMRGILRLDWRPWKFWTYMLDGFYSSIICFFFPYLLLNNLNLGTFTSQTGHNNNSLVELGAYIAAPAILVVNTFVLINTARWDWLFMLIWFISNALFWAWTGIYSQFQTNLQFYGLANHVFGALTFWACFALTTVAALLPRICIIGYRALYAPEDSDLIREQVKLGNFGEDHAGPIQSDTSSDTSQSKPKHSKKARDPFRDGASGSEEEENFNDKLTSTQPRRDERPVSNSTLNTQETVGPSSLNTHPESFLAPAYPGIVRVRN